MNPQQTFRRAWTRYVIAIAIVAFAAALRIWPLQALGSTLAWLTFYPAVMVVAVYGGFSAGLLATVLACLTATFLWPLLVAYPFIKNPADWLGMSVFILTGCMISAVAEAMRRAQARAIKAQEQLRAASLYTRSLIEASLDPLVTISPAGKITDVNQATEGVTGRSRAELIGTDFSDYFTEPNQARAGYQQAFLKGSVTDYPLALRHSDGHVTEVSYNASVYRDEAGIVLGVFAAARDITELKRAEAARMQLAAIVESSNDAIVGKTPDGNITSWNKAAENIYGYAADEIIGKHITILAPPMLHAEIHELLDKVRNGGTVVNHESERIRKDGALIHVELTLSPIRDASGNITGISTIARDITERRQAAEKIRQLKDELEQRVIERTAELASANKELEEFSYSMSHDMRTPLRALDGFSKILLEEHGTGLDDEGRRLLGVLRDNARRMGRLVDDILHFLSMGRWKMELGSVDIANLASEIFTQLQAAAPARRLRLEIGTLPPAWGDRDMIREVLQNLLSNALKFSPVDGEALIEVGGATENEENCYYVKDRGVGFDMRYADKLFRVFERVHPTGQYEGSGIGLAIVKRIVGRHGGYGRKAVWVKARPSISPCRKKGNDMNLISRRQFIISLGGLAIALTMPGCGWLADKPVSIAAHVWPGYELMFLARNEGGLDAKQVNLVETTSATDSLQALTDGKVDGAALTLDEVLEARSRGMPLAVVMVFDISAGADVLIARPGIKKLAGLKGRRIGYEAGALGALMLAEALRAGGLTKKDVKLVSLAINEQHDAWMHDQVDALVTYEPVSSQLLAQGAVKLFDSRQIPNTIVDVLAVRSDVLDRSHASAIRHLLSAHFRALNHLNHNPHDAAYRMSSHLGLPEGDVLLAFKGLLLPDASNNRLLLTGSPPPLLDSARKLSALMVEEGLLPRDDTFAGLLRAEFLPSAAGLN